jgi:hypothetical protein
MKHKDLWDKTMRLIVLLLLITQGSGFGLHAQCGNVSSYRPTANTTTACSGTQVSLYATGLPVANWIYRDNGTGPWTLFSFSSDNASQYVYVSTNTVRTYRAVVSTLSCLTDTTLGLDVTITPGIYGVNNAIKLSASAKQVCSGSQLTVRKMNMGVQSVAWLYRDNGAVSWTTYSFSSSDAMTFTMPYTATPLTREFRIITRTSNSCQQDSSAILSVIVSPVTAGYNPNIAPVSTQSTICGNSGVTLQVDWALEVGNWIYRDAGSSSWQTFSSNSTSAYDYATNVPASTVREYKVILINPSNCTADTSESYYVNINASIGRNLTSIMPRISGGTKEVCAGNSVTFQIPGYSNIQSWIYKDSATGTWNNFGSSSFQSLNSSSSLTKDLIRTIKVIINNSGTTCSIDTSAEISYKVKANVRGNTTTVPFATNSEVCIGAQPTIYLQNGQTITSWLYRSNNTGTWQNSFSSGNSFIDYNTSSLTVNTLRSYKAIISNTNTCRIDTSMEVQVLYKLPTAGGTVAITPTINQTAYCGGSGISGNVSLTSNSRQVSKWIYRDNNTGVWNDLPFQTSTFFSDNSTNVTSATVRSYKVLIKNLETFKVDTSLEITVTINPVSRGNIGVTPTASLAQICNDNSLTLNIVPPTGYSVYYWMYRDTINQSWNQFSSGSTITSNYISTTKPIRSFRVILLNSEICKYDTTNEFVVTVNKKTARNNASYQPVANNASICGGTSLNVSISLPTGANVSKWIYRDNGSAWKETFSSSTSYFESNNNTRVLVPTAREYKVVINDNNNCYSDTSAGVIVNISPMANGAMSGITPTTNTSLVCAGTNFSVTVNYSGSVQKWAYRDNGASWREFDNGTGSTYLSDYNTLLPTLTNREYRAYLIRQNTCIVDTTQGLTVQIKPFTNGQAPAIQPAASSPNICSGSSYNVNINTGTGYDVHKWIFRDNNAGEWREIANYSQSSYYTESNNTVAANTLRSYRAIIQTNTCTYDTTAQVTVQLNARTYGYANAVTLTSSNGVYCSTAPISANVINTTMPSGASVRRWIYMDNMSGTWFAVPSSQSSFITHSFTYVTVPTSRSYRAIINNTTTCSYDSSGIFSVSINPSGNGYASTITPTISQANICNANTNPNLSVSLPAGYTILKWVVNSNGTGWTDFGYNTNSTFVTDYNTAVQSPVSRSYRAIVSNNNSCSIDSTNTVSASISPAIRGVLSTVSPTSGRTNYCYTKSVSVNVSTPSGYTIEKWIYNDNITGPWIEFPFSTSSFLTDNNTYVSATTSRSYRVIMFNSTTCQSDTTSSLTVVLNPRSSNIGTRAVQPTATPALGICSGSSVSLNVTPGTGNEVSRWTYSDNGPAGPWYDILGSYNASSFSHNLTQTTTALSRAYRAIITDTSTCDFDSTLAVVMNITPITYGTDTAINVSGLDTVCVGTAVSVNVSPGSGNSVNKWIYRDNSGVWKNFTSTTTSNFLTDLNTLLAPGSTRGYTPLIYKSAVCRIDTLTKVKNVYFKNKTYGNSATTVFSGADTVCAGNSLSMSTSGSVERWMYRDGNSGPWNVIANSASTFLSHSATGVTSSTWRYYRALISTGSCNADTSNADSTFLKIQTNGNSAQVPTTSNTTVCAGNSVNVNLAFISGANMQRWIYRDQSTGPWIILSTSSSFSVTDYNTSVSTPITRSYRAIVLRNCSYDTTAALTVTITPKGKGTDLTKIPTATSTTVCAASPVQNIQVAAGSGNSIVQWLYRNTGGTWQIFSYGGSNNLSDYNTLTGVSITREYVAIINNNTTCSYDTTTKLTVTINPVVLGNSSRTVTAPVTACMNNNYTISMNVASDTSVIRFLHNTNGGAWMDRGYISPTSNASVTDYAYNGSSYTKGYRAILYKAGNCHIDTTAATTVSVIPRTYGNDNGIAPSVAASACSGSNVSVSVSPGPGNTVSQWLFSDDGMNWNPIYLSSNFLSQQVNTVSGITRQYRAIIVKANSCSIDTTASASVTVNPIIYGSDSLAQVTITSGKPGCTGAAVNINVNPGSNSVNKWIFSDNNGAWNNMYYSSNSVTDYNTFVSSSIDRVYAVLIWKQASCHMDTTTLNDTINISPRTYGNDNGITITPSSSSVCIGSAVGLSAATGSHTVEKWYYRDNGGVWNTLSNSSSSFVTDYNTSVAASTTREYRALIRKSNVCAFDTSATATITISPRSVGTDNLIIPTANNANVCSGSYVNISVNPGSGNSIQKWIYRQDGGVWMDFYYTSATSVNDYSTVVSGTTVRQYKAIVVKGSGCSIDTSAAVTVTFNPIGFGNQNSVTPVASKAAVCAGSGITLSVSGFTGTSVLRWLYRDLPTDPWTVVYTSSTVFSDFNTNVGATITRQYRAIVNNSNGCSTDTTAMTSVSISPIVNGTIGVATQSSQPTVCSGNPVNVFINPPAGRTVNSWLYKETGGSWLPFNFSTSTSVNDFNTTVLANTTREYRAILNNAAGCSLDSAQIVAVNINLITQGTNLGITPNTTTPNLCSGNTAIVSVSGFSGTVIGWLYRDTVVGGWNTIFNNNFTLFHTNTFVSYSRTRQYRAIVYNANNCSNDTTAAVQVQINPQLAGNANAIVPTATDNTVCSGTAVSLNATGFINGGTVTGWVYNDNGGNWILINGAFGASYIHSATTVTGLTTRNYRALVLTGCTTDTTAAVIITLDKYPAKPTVTVVAGTDSLICPETATTYEWRLNGNIITGANAKTYVATQDGNYTVEIGNATGCKTLSDPFVHNQTGLQDAFAHVIVSVYPNPTPDGNITVSWNGLQAEKVKVTIMDMLGRIVLTKEIEVAGTFETMIDLSAQQQGVYFITIHAEGNSITKKILYSKQ